MITLVYRFKDRGYDASMILGIGWLLGQRFEKGEEKEEEREGEGVGGVMREAFGGRREVIWSD